MLFVLSLYRHLPMKLSLALSTILVASAYAQQSLRGAGGEGRGLAATAAGKEDDSLTWWEPDLDPGQHPWNIAQKGNTISMTIKPNEESVKINSKDFFMGGRFTVKMKSASVMPGVVTAIYLASGQGRTGDSSTGSQDEIDFEVKGNEPNMVRLTWSPFILVAASHTPE